MSLENLNVAALTVSALQPHYQLTARLLVA